MTLFIGGCADGERHVVEMILEDNLFRTFFAPQRTIRMIGKEPLPLEMVVDNLGAAETYPDPSDLYERHEIVTSRKNRFFVYALAGMGSHEVFEAMPNSMVQMINGD